MIVASPRTVLSFRHFLPSLPTNPTHPDEPDPNHHRIPSKFAGAQVRWRAFGPDGAPIGPQVTQWIPSQRRVACSLRMRSAPVVAFSPIGGRPPDFVTGSFATACRGRRTDSVHLRASAQSFRMKRDRASSTDLEAGRLTGLARSRSGHCPIGKPRNGMASVRPLDR